MSLRLRIVLVYILLVALSFSCVIYLIINDVRPRYLEAVEESVVDAAELIAAMLSRQAEDGELHLEALESVMASLSRRTLDARIYNIVKRKVALRIYITDDKGILLYDSTGRARPGADFSRWNDVIRTLRGEYGARSTRTSPDDPSSSVLYVAAPIIKNGEIYGVVSVGKPTNSISFLISIAKKRFLFSLLLVAATAVALAVVLSWWVARPVSVLTEYANAIRRGEKRRLPVLGRSEIGQLGVALDEMQARLEGKNYIEDYVRGLTHELKSPLTGIKGAGEILREHVTDAGGVKFLDNIDAEVERLHSLVDRMLQLSRLENVRAITRERFASGDFFRGITDSFQSSLEQKNLELQVDAPPGTIIEGDALLLRQAVGNLVANSIDFSPPGSAIEVGVYVKGESLHIVVRDYGAGVPDFAEAKLFEKFFSLSRPDGGKKSTGLGLPFVREVAALHGGEVRLQNKNPGFEAVLIVPL